MSKKTEAASEPQTICFDCAELRGWKPVPWPVTVWESRCDVCGLKKAVTDRRDYTREMGERK